jgi:hypothetical protein
VDERVGVAVQSDRRLRHEQLAVDGAEKDLDAGPRGGRGSVVKPGSQRVDRRGATCRV